MEDEKIHEGEVIEESKALARTTPVTVEELAAAKDGLEILERRITILKSLRAASIALTFPQDWVLFKAEDRITGYLQDVGCQRVFALWGIDPIDWTDFERTDDKETGQFAMSISGGGFCKNTNQTVETLTGTRYSYEEFIVKRRLPALQIEPEVKKAARANLEGNILRTLAGLKSVPMEELDEVWARAGMTWKSSKFCARGRGFGTQAERQGAQVQQSDDMKPGEEPICEGCDRAGRPTKMKFVAAGISSRTQKPYDAFWSCTIKDSGHKTMPHAEHMKSVLQRREASEKATQSRQAGEE